MASTHAGYQPIDLATSRYDLTTFRGRLSHFSEITSPLTLFKSNAQLLEAQKLLQDYGKGQRRDLYNPQGEEQVWKAKQLVDSSLHPDTKKPVPLPFRMAAFTPTNLVIVAGMLMPNPSIRQTIFWQAANQTLNVCVNYSNATADATMTPSEIGLAYVSATTTSVGLAVGLNQLVPRLRSISPSTRSLLTRFVPFVAVASAGFVNIALMRWKEIKDGIDVFPPPMPKVESIQGQGSGRLEGSSEEDDAKSLGKSSKAGAVAVGQTAASRILTNIPTLILPPVIMTMLGKRNLFKGPNGKRLETITHLGLIGTALLAFLPPAIAFFPQRGTISTESLEPRFRDLTDPRTGKKLEFVEFNKGL